MDGMVEALIYRPVTIEEWPDVQRPFAEHGVQNGCWCMYWRVKRAEFHAQYGEPLRQAMERLIEGGPRPRNPRLS